ncbi:MAG: PEP/pyruvate-binding domain-containing protein [Myxococcales bacterium]
MFAPFTWPVEPAPAPLAVTRLGLFPARFLELQNTSSTAVDLSGYRARLQPFGPGAPLPPLDGGDAIATLPWPLAGAATGTTLQPGARVLVPIPATAEAPLDGDPEREGVLNIFRLSDGVAVDRVDFMRWPDGATLARERSSVGALGTRFQFCAGGDLNMASTDDCQPLPARAVGDRLHDLRTPGDFAGLAEGSTELASQSVKFVVDMDAGDTVHFLGSRRWDLHYRFIRERIYDQMPLDRCDPLQAAEFNEGWIDYSLREYFKVERRFLLGTLVRWAGSGLATVEFAVGDVITGEQMRRAFFAVTGRVPDPERWAVRPQAADQVARIRDVEGTLPIVDPSAPFRDQTFQPLVAATGYGVLQFVAGPDLATTPLGPDVIVITDEVPNDISLVGGLITEAFQTPLAHVAVLSKNRGTPNMALLGARSDPRVAPYLNKLVRFEVSGAGFKIAETTPAEATMFWDSLRPKGPRLAPRLDTSVRSLVDLTTTGALESLPVVGAKAAQIGELYRLSLQGVACPAGLPLPRAAFAVPVVHYLEHFQRSGAAALFATRSADPAFAADPMRRAAALAEIRAAITTTPVEPGLLDTVRAAIAARFGTARVRLRSSSNTEDLPGFTGAGLYTSVSAAVGDPDPDLDVGQGLRTVWASLWQPRAFDEREQALVDHTTAAMGVLVEPAFTNERANGVAVSRNVLDPIYGDAYYFNAQAGEASVTNPAPGVTSEQGTFRAGDPPRIDTVSRSSLIAGQVISPAELGTLMCALGAIHDHFRGRLDPARQNRWFAMDIEWKLLGPERQLVIKQARPFSFGRADVPADCREF